MKPKTWISTHFRKQEVQIEINMQSPSQPAYIFRLMYRRRKGESKGVIARRQLRTHTSIGRTQWDGSVYADAMTEFETEHKAVIRKMAVAWLQGDEALWKSLLTQLELDLENKAKEIK